jgi:phytoene dehydrogenase-like protein
MVHLGGALEEVARSESDVAAGRGPGAPLLHRRAAGRGRSHAPAGKQALWAYCHVPAGSTVEMADRIEAQIERFAPGFRDLILARAVRTAAGMERCNPNYAGGDINGGAGTLRQTIFRPAARWSPYRTRSAGYTCARRRLRLVAGCTGCAAPGPPGPRCPTWA